MREWTDKSGQRHVRMALLSVDGEKLLFRKADGKLAATTIPQICEADRQYVANFHSRKLQEVESRAAVEDFFASPLVRLLLPRSSHIAGMQRWVLPVSAAAVAQLGSVLQPDLGSQSQPTPATLISLRLSRNFLEDFIHRSIKYSNTVRDCILGTRVVGTANVTAHARLVLQPNSTQAVANIELTGTALSRTLGFNGPAILHNAGQMPFSAHKRMVIGQAGLDLSPAEARARAYSQTLWIDSVLPRLRGRIVKWIAGRRAEIMRPLANSITAEKAAAGIGAALNEQVRETVAEVQQTLRSRIPNLPYHPVLLLAAVQFRSTAECVEIAMVRRGATSEELALQPPVVEGNPDIAIRIHSTALRSAVTTPEVRQALLPLLTELLQERKSQETPSASRFGAESLAGSLNMSFGAGWILADFTDPNRQRTAAAPNLPVR